MNFETERDTVVLLQIQFQKLPHHKVMNYMSVINLVNFMEVKVINV
jgi:hypothetical protein